VTILAKKKAMPSFVTRRFTAVWFVLMLATALSWESTRDAESARWGGTAVLIIAFIKVRLIGLEFMELRLAPSTLRRLFEGWVIAACASLLFIYWFLDSDS
jgi:Prokaryotic Cytochrome C oxidase subunit IV